MKEATLLDLQKKVDLWIKEVGKGYYDELTNMAILTEEVGELARVMSRTYGMQRKKENEILNLEDELADVIWVLLCIANQTDIDLTKAMDENFVKKNKRDKNRFG
jgi:NTP pyrophosphatase (non-canonical NTP hydrolase)